VKTLNELEANLDLLNKKISTYLNMTCQARYGYIGLDLYQGNVCLRTIGTGTLDECYEYALEYVVDYNSKCELCGNEEY